MSGWNSLDSVATLHILLQLAGFLAAAVVIAAGMTAYHFWNRFDDLVAIADRARAQYAPAWRGDTALTLHNGFAGVSILGIALLMAFAYAAREYGHRTIELVAAEHRAAIAKVRSETDALRLALVEPDKLHTAMLRRALVDSDTRHAATMHHALQEAEVRHLAETAALRRELEQAQSRRTGVAADRDNQARLASELETLNRAYDNANTRHAAEIAALRRELEQAQPRRAEAAAEIHQARLAAELEKMSRAYDTAHARHATETAELRQAVKHSESKRIASVESLRWEVRQAESRSEAEIARLKDQLSKAERKLAALQSTRRLSMEEKHALIDALSPFRGQKVSIAAIEGDEDGKGFAADFAEVFEAAGWEPGAVSYRRWDRDPVGVEITLNEADGRAGRATTGVGALINITRKLCLVDGNTIYMNGEVAEGEVLLKIGKKLPR